ncbi:MAG: bifunctional metallophosphatase/5'-nucleotidase [Lachnospiraceae bacterium]|nr:bifunctional metallophosphatase/5'-nucleotidase [Lachnospiraceae bacterium]
MRIRNRLLSTISLMLILIGVLSWNRLGAERVLAAEQEKELEVIFLSDIHSHFGEFSTKIDGEDVTIGGVARIQTMLEEQLSNPEEALFIDGGDFAMGTLLQTLFCEEAAELRMLGAMGCDVTTLGNHEFDYLSDGLAAMLNNAVASGDVLPELVLCNVDWAQMEADGLSKGQQQIKEAFANYNVKDYTVLERNGVRIAVTGVFGKAAYKDSPTCELLFTDPVKAVKETVQNIQKQEEVDMIVCVSHSGMNLKDASKSEDEILAQEVPELDLILSGHSHILLQEPICYGDTYIVAPGAYAEYLGTCVMKQKENGRWQLDDYAVTLVDTNAAEEEAIKDKLEGFLEQIDDRYLKQFGYESVTQVLAENDIEFCASSELSRSHTEQNLGSIIADAYVEAARTSGNVGAEEICIGIAPAGTIRDTFVQGNITVNDVFNVFSLGVGADGETGYPLICVRLTGEDVLMAAEIDATVSEWMTTARLYTSGFHFTYNPHRILLNKVADAYVTDASGNRVEIDKKKKYTIVTDMYTAQMLGAVSGLSYGLIEIPLYDMQGNKVADLNDVIMYEAGREVKAWHAIARYMQSFADTNGNGVPDVPASYATTQGRKIVDDSRNIFDILSHLNIFGAVILGVCLLVVGLAVTAVVLVARRIAKKQKSKNDGIMA